ncbi:MAG: hypothetical protein IJ661_09315 [Lachnospiraceae bacterium]|nr:hypothetical protein [Lachnospiraceae bacterium]
MADISVTKTQINPVNNPVTPAKVNNSSNIKAVDTPEIQKEDRIEDSKSSEERRERIREELLENVVSVSEDGDTVQVSDDGADKLEDVVNQADIYDEETPINELKPDSYYVEMTKAAQEDKKIDILDNEKNIIVEDSDDVNSTLNTVDSDDKVTNITSFNGYTDTQLEQMYLKGEISKYNYDQEMNARETEREELQDNNENASKQVMATVNGMERVSQDAAQIKQAFAEDSVTAPDAAQRVEIMSTLQDFTKF